LAPFVFAPFADSGMPALGSAVALRMASSRISFLMGLLRCASHPAAVALRFKVTIRARSSAVTTASNAFSTTASIACAARILRAVGR
jgi:hypothetical protein